MQDGIAISSVANTVATLRQTVTTFPRKRDKKSVQFNSWEQNHVLSTASGHGGHHGIQSDTKSTDLNNKLKSIEKESISKWDPNRI